MLYALEHFSAQGTGGRPCRCWVQYAICGKHEILEKELIKNGMTQEQAHIEASMKHNYSKESGEYYAKIEKYKKE